MFSIIVAIANNNAIGKNNDLLWYIPEDLKSFKRITSGCTVIMGRKTYDSLPFKPLPNRRNVVITSEKTLNIEGCEVVNSVEEAIDVCDANQNNFVIGGAKVYEQFMPIAQRMYVTKVDQQFDADTFFPEIDYRVWVEVEKSDLMVCEKSGLKYQYYIYEKK